jgi:iron complex transport system ATP-binding protein
MSGPVLATHGLSVGYHLGRGRARVVLAGVNVALQSGEFACMLGSNGVGKSTLLRALSRVQRPLAGYVTIDGKDIRRMNQQELARRLSVVLTERVDAGILSAYDLVGLGRYPHTGWAGRLTPYDHQVVRWALGATGSEDLAGRNVQELSDGERQRVMIARALAQEPAVMLLDEPTAFLDLPRRVETTGLLRRLTRETGLAVLLSTHDLELALRTADTIWLVTAGGGILTGSPEDLAMTGAFDAAFSGDDLAFDPRTGGFRFRTAHTGWVLLQADGPSGLWTRRALEREGFAIIEDGAGDTEPAVQVVCIEDCCGPRWRSKAGDDIREHATLAELCWYLRAYAVNAAPVERPPSS